LVDASEISKYLLEQQEMPLGKRVNFFLLINKCKVIIICMPTQAN